MKKALKITLSIAVIVVVVGGILAMVKSKEDKKNDQIKTVEVTRGNIVDKALAVGSIEPKVKVDVKSKISGVVAKLFADAGDYVKAGAPLIEIKPTPTPQELVTAQRNVEQTQINLQNAQSEYRRQKELKKQGYISEATYENSLKAYEQAKLQLGAAQDALDLLKKGSIESGKEKIESIVTAPISGYILEKKIEIGDPVVPLTSYQAGTVLMTMADMHHLLFRGTVDEIDVGKLKEKMPATIKIGALPDAVVKGVVSRIALQSEEKDNSVVFPVEIKLTQTNGNLLRAGYSANAEIVVQRRKNVLMIPERLVTFSGDTSKVEVEEPDGKVKTKIIKTGLSDAMNIQVVKGLKKGDKVVEKPPKEIH